MSTTNKTNNQGDTSVVEKTKEKPLSLKKYNVIFYNDDFTSMEFVIIALMEIFNHPEEVAAQLMMTVHLKGQAVAGTYVKEIAEQKVIETMAFAKETESTTFVCEAKEAN